MTVTAWIAARVTTVALAATAAAPTPGSLEERGRTHLYNLDFDAAGDAFRELTEIAPGSPAGPYYQATTLWMEEFSRRGGMAGSTFRSNRYWGSKHHEEVSPELARKFHALTDEAIRRSMSRLESEPTDREALFFLGATNGIASAYFAAVERSYYQSYKAGRRAKKLHEQLLAIDETYADAYLLPGIFEYTVATLPRTLRFAGMLIGIRGSREKGIELVERAVAGGSRTRWAARLALSVLQQREKNYGDALRVLSELEQRFPRNPLLPLERGTVHVLRREFVRARRAFRQVQAGRKAGRGNYDVVEPSLIHLKIGEAYLFDKKFEEAGRELDRALGTPGVPERIKAVVFLRRGMASDGAGVRAAARADYRRALRMDVDSVTNRLAKRYMKDPYR